MISPARRAKAAAVGRNRDIMTALRQRLGFGLPRRFGGRAFVLLHTLAMQDHPRRSRLPSDFATVLIVMSRSKLSGSVVLPSPVPAFARVGEVHRNRLATSARARLDRYLARSICPNVHDDLVGADYAHPRSQQVAASAI